MKKIITSISVIMTATLVVSGLFIFNPVLAAATVTPASGGTNISIDTTSASGGDGTFVSLVGPGITENEAGDIAEGTHTITLPVGWEFDTTSTISIFNINIVLGSTSIVPDTNSFSFTVTQASTEKGMLGFSSLKVRPTGTDLTDDDMTYSGAGIVGVNENTNFGTLSTVAGTVTQLAFTIQPGSAEYGLNLSPQPVVKTQDRFSNDSTNELDANKMVTLFLAPGTGELQGIASLDIGINKGKGTAAFNDLKVSTIGTKQLTASADGFTSAISDNFEINQKELAATIVVADRDYDSTTAAEITNIALVGIVGDDDVTADFSAATATFDNENAGEDKTVSATGITIDGVDVENYTFDGIATGVANITQLEITITPDTNQTKVYGEDDPTFAYTFNPALIGDDNLTGALNREEGKDIGSYTYTLGDLSAGNNYSLTLVPEIFVITKRTLNVTATGVDKIYDTNTTATVTLSDDRVSGDDITFGYTATFADENVDEGKPVSVSGISITGGDDAGNYTLANTTAETAANITPKPLTVTFTTDADKIYDGTTAATIVDVVRDGVIGVENVDVDGGLATFADKHVGDNKTVTATGFTLTGVDVGNYTIGTINTTTGNVIPRPITVTAVTDNKIYDGTENSDKTLIITSDFLPAIVGDDVANFVQTYDNKNVGENKILTPSGSVNDGNGGNNYTYTFIADPNGVITQKSINITAQPDSKIYDGTTDSDENPVVDTLEAGDEVGTPPSQSFDTKDFGTGKTLTASGLIINDGNGGANYNVIYVTDTTGVIIAKELTVTGATTNSKIYDGSTVAIVSFGSPWLDGVIGSEDVTLNSSGYSATFDDKDVNIGKTVTVLGLALDGIGASNYSLTQPVLTDGVISTKTLNVTATGVNKVYDATTDATITLSDDRISGDNITLEYAATFADKNIGIGKTVTISSISITGADSGNYTLDAVPTSTTADITPKPLTDTATVIAENKVYDSNNSATITDVNFPGVEAGDNVVVNFSAAVATFADANVGTNKVVSATGIIITGADVGNYTYDGTATGLADILQIPTMVFVDGAFTEENAGVHTFSYDAFGTIQEGIDAVDVGGTIYVAAGTYPEKLDPKNKSLTLNGTGVDSTIIDTSLLTGYAIQNFGDSTTIKNLTLIGTTDSYGFKVSHVSGITIQNVKVENSYRTGIDLNTVNGATLNNIEVTGTSRGFGLMILDSNDVDVTDVTTSNNAWGGVSVQTKNAVSDSITFSGTFNAVENFPLLLEEDPSVYYDITNVTLPSNFGYVVYDFREGDNYKQWYYFETLDDAKTAAQTFVVSASPVYSDVVIYDVAEENYYVFEGMKIQDAIAAVSDGATINIGEGTYNESVLIGESLNLVGSDATKPVITGVSGTNYIVKVDATDDVLIDNFEINGGGSGTGDNTFDYGIWLDNTDNIEIKNSVVTNIWKVSSNGIQIDSSTNSNIHDNDLTHVHKRYVRYINSDGKLYNNEIIGDNVDGTSRVQNLVNLWGGSTVEIYNNVLHNALTEPGVTPTWDSPGIFVSSYGGSGASYANIYENEIYNCDSGIVVGSVYAPTDTSSADITNNNLHNLKWAINFEKSTVSATIIKNKFSNNTVAINDDVNGVHVAPADVTAEMNWWGSTNGPATGLIFDTVDYRPWCVEETCSVEDYTVPTIISYTPSDNAVGIDPTSDITVTFDETVNILPENINLQKEGDEPVIVNVTFDDTAKLTTINPDTDLDDNSTYTITLSGLADMAGNLMDDFSWSFTTAASYSIELEKGWNLISLPVTPTTWASTTEVLASVNGNVERVWSYDAVSGVWSVYNADGVASDLNIMTAGHGYWVKMAGDDTLTGVGTLYEQLIPSGDTPSFQLPEVPLAEGWNLIGYYQLPGEVNAPIKYALSKLDGYWSGYGSDLITFTKGTLQPLTPIYEMQPGEGYWIFMSSAKKYSFGDGDF